MVQFGIWSFDEKLGLMGRPEKFPELYLGIEKIWDVKETETGPVWKWPVNLAEIGWFTPQVANDFNKTFFYAQNYFEGFRPLGIPEKLEIDSRTIRLQTEVLSDSFPGPDEELSARA